MPERRVDRRGHVLGRLRVGRGVAADLVRRADHPAALHAAAGEEDASAPRPSGRGPAACRTAAACVIFGVRPNSPAITISVESSRPRSCRSSSRAETRPVGRREELVLQVREGVAVRVPGLVVAEVHLHQVDARLDQPPRPSAATSRRRCGRSGRGRVGSASVDVERPPDRGVGQQRDGRLAVSGRTAARSPPRRAPRAGGRSCRAARAGRRAGRRRRPRAASGRGRRNALALAACGRSWWSNSYSG